MTQASDPGRRIFFVVRCGTQRCEKSNCQHKAKKGDKLGRDFPHIDSLLERLCGEVGMRRRVVLGLIDARAGNPGSIKAITGSLDRGQSCIFRMSKQEMPASTASFFFNPPALKELCARVLA